MGGVQSSNSILLTTMNHRVWAEFIIINGYRISNEFLFSYLLHFIPNLFYIYVHIYIILYF